MGENNCIDISRNKRTKTRTGKPGHCKEKKT